MKKLAEPLISIDPKACTNCFTCIRICPVKAIKAPKSEPCPQVVDSRCIGCGDCVDSCAPKAINYRSSIEETKAILKSKATTIAIVSPSISAEFDDITDYRKFVQMVRSLGVDFVNETSFGVDVIAYKYLQFFSNFKGMFYLTSCDPVVVNFVEKYHPKLIHNLTPFVSPTIATSIIVRQKYGSMAKVIYIGPEIAAKNEILRYEGDARIDVAITFRELRQLFEEFKIDENTVEFSEFNGPIGYKGSLYPLSNGLVQAADIDENLLTAELISLEGKQRMMSSIEEFENNVKVIHRHLHIMYGNTLKGPGMTNKENTLLKEHLVIKYANKRLTNFFRKEWYNDLQQYMTLDYSTEFKSDDQRLPNPPAQKIKEALKALDKQKGDDANCNQCGYNSCKDFAVDMAKGIVTPEMCSTFAVKNSQYFSNTLKELNEKLAVARNELREMRDQVESEHDQATRASELNDAILEKLRAGIVFVDYKMKIVKANYTFCKILGEEAEEINEVIPGLVNADLRKLLTDEICNLFSYVITNSESIDGRDVRNNDILLNMSIFPIRENNIAGAIVRDMQAPEVQKAEVVTRISDVIDKNLEMVQKIGFLLGEGASDIEKMLNSVIQFYQDDSKK